VPLRLAFLCLSVIVPPCWAAPALIGAPNVAPTLVDDSGALVESWGAASVRLVVEGVEAPPPRTTPAAGPYPAVLGTTEAGGLKLESSCFRAPIWPTGVDVLAVTVTSTASQPTEASLRLDVPETVGWGEREGIAGGRVVARIPEDLEPVRVARDWGCATPAQRLPGWARPGTECGWGSSALAHAASAM